MLDMSAQILSILRNRICDSRTSALHSPGLNRR